MLAELNRQAPNQNGVLQDVYLLLDWNNNQSILINIATRIEPLDSHGIGIGNFDCNIKGATYLATNHRFLNLIDISNEFILEMTICIIKMFLQCAVPLGLLLPRLRRLLYEHYDSSTTSRGSCEAPFLLLHDAVTNYYNSAGRVHCLPAVLQLFKHFP